MASIFDYPEFLNSAGKRGDVKVFRFNGQYKTSDYEKEQTKRFFIVYVCEQDNALFRRHSMHFPWNSIDYMMRFKKKLKDEILANKINKEFKPRTKSFSYKEEFNKDYQLLMNTYKEIDELNAKLKRVTNHG